MKQFFKMLLASILGTAIGIFCLSTFFLIVLLAGIGSVSSTVFIPEKNQNVLKISLSGTIDDYSESNPFIDLFSETPQLALKDILTAVEKAKNNDAIKGIYLDVKTFSTGTANVDAIRRSLNDFRESGKFVVAYADQYTQTGYYLASAADYVYMNPKGMLLLRGLASETMFYKGILEKIGVKMEVFKVGTYKGAVEPYINEHLSDANREQITSYLGGIWENITEGIAESRGINTQDINSFADRGLFFADAEETVECGFVDSLLYLPEVEAKLKELAGQTSDKFKTLSVSDMNKTKSSTKQYRNKIAVIYAEGEIVSASNSQFLITQKNITDRLAVKLHKLIDDETVKAVVLRVNSPGGDAYVSEQIWHEVEALNRKKPVVVSMGSVAASGGYYISCAARKIVAEANTLTGSIGIFGMYPNVSSLYDKLALTADIVKTNTYADIGDAGRSMNDDERALIQSYIERGYELFLTRCADGRGKSRDAIDAIGQGRVWTGEQALEIGLVDEIGGIDRAIELAVELANIYNYTLINIPSADNSLKELLQKQLKTAKTSVVKDVMGDEAFQILNLQQQAGTLYGIKARIPYNLKPL
ncbi:MAG: signal peptide peptidase SppA [Tannerella sp.]|nr:signal peptide peptidase SppA [Tannerella sp.]